MVLCTGYTLMGSVGFAADEGSVASPAIPVVQADPDTEALLRAIEQQIVSERMVLPANDNAMETWRRVLQRQVETQTAAGFVTALGNFEKRARRVAAKENAAGRALVAAELVVFADQAGRLAGTIPPIQSPAAGPKATAVEIREAPAVKSTAATSASDVTHGSLPPQSAAAPASAGDTVPHNLPPAQSAGVAASPTGTVTGAAPVEPLARQQGSFQVLPRAGWNDAAVQAQPSPVERATRDTSPVSSWPDPSAPGHARVANALATTSAVQSLPPTAGQPTAQDQAIAVFYATRGDEMLARKDISAARKFYEYAANAGSARAAAALAKTFDAAFNAQFGIVGLKPDPALAAAWYRRAAELGDQRIDASTQYR
jgi:hypothetical protein